MFSLGKIQIGRKRKIKFKTNNTKRKINIKRSLIAKTYVKQQQVATIKYKYMKNTLRVHKIILKVIKERKKLKILKIFVTKWRKKTHII